MIQKRGLNATTARRKDTSQEIALKKNVRNKWNATTAMRKDIWQEHAQVLYCLF